MVENLPNKDLMINEAMVKFSDTSGKLNMFKDLLKRLFEQPNTFILFVCSFLLVDIRVKTKNQYLLNYSIP